jgi:DNA-binding MarR family transcriptional regulator
VEDFTFHGRYIRVMVYTFRGMYFANSASQPDKENPLPDLPLLFEQLVRLQIELWNAADARLRSELGTTLGNLESMRVINGRGICRVNDIADDLVITVGGASKIVDRLEASGTCVRSANPDDRRSSLIALTDKGRDELARATAVLAGELAAWFGSVAPETVESLTATLTALRNAAPELTTR